jgi:hypothetical protein
MAAVPQQTLPHLSEVPSVNVVTMLRNWNHASHPKMRALSKNLVGLRREIEAIPAVRIEWCGVAEDPGEIEASREEGRSVLDVIRSILLMLEGANARRVVRQASRFFPSEASALQAALDEAVGRLRDSERSIEFAIGEEPGIEWLPEPTPPDDLPSDCDAIELDL